jgi:hypothetical protein
VVLESGQWLAGTQGKSIPRSQLHQWIRDILPCLIFRTVPRRIYWAFRNRRRKRSKGTRLYRPSSPVSVIVTNDVCYMLYGRVTYEAMRNGKALTGAFTDGQ